jgi:hypothetical protein
LLAAFALQDQQNAAWPFADSEERQPKRKKVTWADTGAPRSLPAVPEAGAVVAATAPEPAVVVLPCDGLYDALTADLLEDQGELDFHHPEPPVVTAHRLPLNMQLPHPMFAQAHPLWPHLRPHSLQSTRRRLLLKASP